MKVGLFILLSIALSGSVSAYENSYGVITHIDNASFEETLKRGEPSYLVKSGSVVRIGWKPKFPDQYFIFFNCNTKLVDTFRERCGGDLAFQGNRAIFLNVVDQLPQAIEHCLQ